MQRDDGTESIDTPLAPRGDGEAPPLRLQLLVAGAVISAGLVLLLSFGVVGRLAHIPYGVWTREMAQQLGVPSYIGILAVVTWFMWVVAGTAGLFAAAVAWRARRTDTCIAFLLLASAFTGLLLLDDFAMLHDQWLLKIGVPESSPFLAYGAIMVVLVLRCRSEFRKGGLVLVATAAVLWAVSLAVDFVADHGGVERYALEDGSKTIGIALWTAFMVWRSHRAVMSEIGSREMSS